MGEPFAGGKADDFQFIVGDGQMLKEFEEAVRGMKAGESKRLSRWHSLRTTTADVAGKTADFLVTLKKIEAAHLPEVDDALAKSWVLPTPAWKVLRRHPQNPREVKQRLLMRNKNAVDALVSKAELDLPVLWSRPRLSAWWKVPVPTRSSVA